MFPNETWELFEFPVLPRHFWAKKENHRRYLEWLADKLDVHSAEEWQKVSVEDLKRHRGYKLLQRYESFYDALRLNFPEYEWDVFASRRNVPRNYWKDDENARRFLDQFVKTYNIKEASDWTRVGKVDIIRFGGSGLLYRTGFLKMIRQYYPEMDWQHITEPSRLPAGYWNDTTNVWKFIKQFEREYRVRRPSDWLRISGKQVRQEGGQSLLLKYGGLYNLCRFLYPDHEWNEADFRSRDKRSVQRLLFVHLQDIFPGEEMVEEFIHDGLTRQLGRAVEFDVYLPNHEIALEYHGRHHYDDIPSFGQLEMYQMRDQEKIDLCQQNQITLIVIPFWWDCSIDSLRATLSVELGERFPSLFPRPYAQPIPPLLSDGQ